MFSSLSAEEYHARRWLPGIVENNRRPLWQQREKFINTLGHVWDFLLSSYQNRLEEWHHHHRTFLWLISCPNARFDPINFHVDCHDQVWRDLSLVCPDVLYYTLEG